MYHGFDGHEDIKPRMWWQWLVSNLNRSEYIESQLSYYDNSQYCYENLCQQYLV